MATAIGIFHEGETHDVVTKTTPAWSYSLTPDTVATAAFEEVDGWGDPSSGVTVSILATHNPSSFPTDSWSANLSYPISWDGIGSKTVTGTGAPPITEIDWNAADLEVSSDCSAVFAFASFLWKLGGATELTIGPQSMAFTGYDRRENKYENACAGGPIGTPIPSAHPDCGSDYASQPAYSITVGGSATGGWTVDGSVDLIAIDNSLLAPTIVCACPEGLPDIGGTRSDNLSTVFEYQDVLTKTMGGSSSGTCDGTAYIQLFWDADQAGHYFFSRLTASPKTSGITTIRQHSDAYCNTVVPFGAETNYDPPDTTTAETIVSYSKTALRWHGHTTCSSGNPCDPGPHSPSFCGYTAHATLGWPVKPACSPGDSCPSYDVSFGLRHYVGWLRGGNFWSAFSDNAGATWTQTDSGIAAEWDCLRVDRQNKKSPAFAWLEIAGQIVRYTSTDEGKTWGMSTTISSGTGNRKPFAIIGRNGIQYEYWIVPNGGGFDVHGEIRDRADNVMVSEFTAIAGVDDAGGAVDEFPVDGGGHKLRLWAIIAGANTAFLSDDGVNFA